ncbi:glycosyltransferase family 2 protein [Lichenifustis flavocetrariae]|uniref:Glycosyltransferase family 2 protein n=1 Tax=Lichenifustis flavocetrariae TaxID=2949735 RepID=A0AA42CLB3_9HYPH|nr:glycosyltransferase family A protein [Lichenifustis flavocetrariae]MCW6511418.1 glycosyltransferase family 2 protein [Lichenifustis flavocetrariae]
MMKDNVSDKRSQNNTAAVIALYNGEHFIERALKSVLSQTQRPNEVLVVDDGSTDKGVSVAESLSNHFPLRILRKPNGGQSSARNLGVAKSSSSLIAFLDQDDLWYPEHIAELSKPFADQDTLAWSYSNLDHGDLHGQLKTANFLNSRPGPHPKTSIRECLARDMFILPSASLVARWAFDAVGGFDERLSGYEDDDLFLRMFAAGFEHAYVDRPLSMWCIHSTSATSLPSMSRSRMIYANKLLERFGSVEADSGTLASVAIVPRFTVSLLGEYVRAVQSRDDARVAQTLEELQRLVLPYASARKRWAVKTAVLFMSFRWFGRLVTFPQALLLVRRVMGLPLPKDHQ